MSWWEAEYEAAWRRGEQAAAEKDRLEANQASADGKWVTLRKAAEIIGRSPQWVSKRLIFCQLVSAEMRGGRRWVLREDAEKMRERYRERDERYELNRELRKTRTKPKLRSGWRAKGPAPVRVDFANTPTRGEGEIWIETARAAGYLNQEPTTFRRMAKARGMAYRDRRIPNTLSGSGHNKMKLVREWALSHVHLLMDEREAFESWRCLAPGQHLDNKGKRHIFTLDDVPPNMWRITVEEAAQILGVCNGRVSQLVRQGRLFGWQAQPGKPGCRLYLDGNQVTRYANSPERLAKRQAKLGTKTADPEKEESRLEFLAKQKIDPETKMRSGATVYRNYREYYSTIQTAEYLGTTRSGVLALMRRRRLQGYQLNPHEKPYATRDWFFFKKADVHALAVDPVYLDYKARHRKGVDRAEAEKAELDREMTEEELKAWRESRQTAPNVMSDVEVLTLEMQGW